MKNPPSSKLHNLCNTATRYCRATTISFLHISRTNLFLVKLPPILQTTHPPIHPFSLDPDQHLETAKAPGRENGLATVRKEDAYVCRSGTRLVDSRGGWCSSEQVCGWNRYIIVRVQRPRATFHNREVKDHSTRGLFLRGRRKEGGKKYFHRGSRNGKKGGEAGGDA